MVGEEQFDIVHNATLLVRFVALELGTLLQASLEVPGDEGHNEECEEDHTGREHLDSGLGCVGADEGMCQRLHRSPKEAAWSEEHAEEQDDHRSESP